MSRPSRNAIKAKGGAKPTGEEVKKGMESIKGFTLGGLVPPMEITPADHEGGGWVQIWTVKGGKLVKVTEWFQGYRDVIQKHLAAINDQALDVLIMACVEHTGGRRPRPSPPGLSLTPTLSPLAGRGTHERSQPRLVPCWRSTTSKSSTTASSSS